MTLKSLRPETHAKNVPASKKDTHTKKHRHVFRTTLFFFVCTSILGSYIFIFLKIRDIHANVENMVYAQEMLKRNITQLFDYTTETRKTLQLPPLLYENFETSDYDTSGIADEESPLDGANDEQTILLKKIEEVYEKYNNDALSVRFSTVLDEQNIFPLAKELNLTIAQKNTTLLVRYDNYIVATIRMLYDDNMTPIGIQYDSELIGKASKVDISTLRQVVVQLHNTLTENKTRAASLASRVNTLLRTPEMSAHFSTENAVWKHIFSSHTDTWEVFNIANESVARIKLSHISVNVTLQGTQLNTENLSNDKIAHEIKEYLLTTNYSTSEELVTKKSLDVLTQTIQDTTFKSQLTQIGLSIVETPEDIGDYYALKIQENVQPTTIGYFAIQKNNGNFWILDSDRVPISQANIFDIVPSNVQNTLHEQNILIVGSHNGLADTIMIAHINSQKQITLISIPRDLYFNGRKINWYFKRFSPNTFNKVISQIIDIPITQYAYVDMYAFVSIINIIGGIHVRLEEDLIDPTYRIKENGKITYLQYSKGEHFLNGIEVLRVARSRYSTTDFDRSTRQQAIIEGIQGTLRTTDLLSYFVNIIKIIRQIRPLISTNLSTYELAKMAQEYRDAVIAKKISLNVDNVLYYTFSHLYENNLNREDVGEEEWGAYILLPRNDDWNILKNYIKRNIM